MILGLVQLGGDSRAFVEAAIFIVALIALAITKSRFLALPVCLYQAYLVFLNARTLAEYSLGELPHRVLIGVLAVRIVIIALLVEFLSRQFRHSPPPTENA